MENKVENEVFIIEQRHKKEKKELQAQIQGLKKTAKNDKTKKKELTAEIARLESELEKRHKEELEIIQNVKNTPLDTEVNGFVEENDNLNGEVRTKISKAQKRRDKKQQQEREREELIKLQEKENINGPRNLENQVLCSKLKERNLKIFSIPSDGDCLYKAISHQLETKFKKSITVDELRSKVAEYILQNKDEFMPFLSNPETYEMLTETEFEEYCDKIKNTKVWGGQLEIRALANCLNHPITVIQATGPEAIEQGSEFTGPPLIISYHRHMYSLGEHYNSTEELVEAS